MAHGWRSLANAFLVLECCCWATRQLILAHVCFSNRPVGVKRLQAIHGSDGQRHSRARASLRNRHIGALPSWDPGTRWDNL